MPVVLATPGKGTQTLRDFKTFLADHKGDSGNILEVVCDMSPAFLSGIDKTWPNAEVTVDWFHIVQTFTRRLDELRKLEHQDNKLPKYSRWAILKNWGCAKTNGQPARRVVRAHSFQYSYFCCVGGEGKTIMD
jgi:transposase